ncbi:PIN domain-containing protein [Adlercreutzia sp. ZJ138]|uniref:PIN domain-containing protein n=1 Tax=Adlercreutzia sp. ZJ138 TaxID=2709405 RepID=UPI0013EB1D40|nr:PIN domain-containing protein [Adlercreutzia sp. ZJ138]
MKVLFDTNVWLDIVLGRKGFYQDSFMALIDCVDEGDEICMVATSLKDVFFIVERMEDPDVAYAAVEKMLKLSRVLTVDDLVCRNAVPLERPDYEDGIVAAAALADEIDCIVTRDTSAFHDVGIHRCSPSEFIKERGVELIDF